MSLDDDRRSAPREEEAAERDERLAALERQVAALAAEVAALRGDARGAVTERRVAPMLDANLAARLREPPREKSGEASRAPPRASTAISGDEIESWIGRYGTLLLAALVILMGVGVLIQVAVSRGLLTPEVRVGFGALAAAVVGGAGVYFHRRGEVRYGNVLLAIALAIVDLVAWGAGPRLHLVPTGVALAIVDVVAVALAALALHDGSEFLFGIAVAAALSSPFVTSDGGGTAPALLAYGACVLIGALRAMRDTRWTRAFAVLAGGALFYALAAAAAPPGTGWYVPFAIVLFGGGSALGALLLADDEWRGTLARAFLAVAIIGVPVGWDRMLVADTRVTIAVGVALAAVTYAALAVRESRQALWQASALALPLVSLGIASAATHQALTQAVVFASWAAFAFGAWQLERRRGARARGAVHLLAAGTLGGVAIARALWPHPLGLVAGLAGWGVLLAAAASEEDDPLPLIAVAVTLGGAALSAMDQLASRQAYAYLPFVTRSSASALCATLGLALAAMVIAKGRGAATRWADRPVRLAVVIGFVILWGRMEVADAFSSDLSTFLLIAYYAACGLASIVAGRQLAVQRLRVAGLGLAIYAAVKAVVGASAIGGVLLRVGAYGAVGVFLLGAGYLYRERKMEGARSDQR